MKPKEGLAALMTVSEVAEFYRVRPQYVYQLVKQGLPCVRVGRRGYLRFDATQVQQWVCGATGEPEGKG